MCSNALLVFKVPVMLLGTSVIMIINSLINVCMFVCACAFV